MTAQKQAAQMNLTNIKIGDSTQRNLYKTGGVGALIVGMLFIIEMTTYIATSAPSLTDPAGWFNLFQNNRLVGLVDFGILELFSLVLLVPMYLALYAALKRASESVLSIAAILAFVGIAANFATS
ncbi:MAG TPA: hypothetical protein VF823_01630, partial [Anaerolineales bacterium]